MTASDEKRLEDTRKYWNQEAAKFDNEPDHGLRHPDVYAAWENLLHLYMPVTASKILDIGCGTGSLSVLLSRLGHDVTGIDLSPVMIEHAQRKANKTGQQINFKVMDASYPQFAHQTFEVVICRHILWSLPEPNLALQRWANLLKPQGRLMTIEGFWNTGGGLHSDQIVAALPDSLNNIQIIDLSKQPDLWGGEVTDKRYAIVADLTDTVLSQD